MYFYVLSALPNKCDNGITGHSRQCQMSVWEEIGCLSSGTFSPDTLNDSMIAGYSVQPLR